MIHSHRKLSRFPRVIVNLLVTLIETAKVPLWWSFQYAICLSDKTLEQSARRLLLSDPLEITY